MMTVENMDCHIGMKQLCDDSVSLVLTDPPYFIDGMGADGNCKSYNP
jgi:site-specific DNA-methyltransferase (adenine-specific)